MKRSQYEWETLTREQQDLYLTLLWDDAHSEQAIADFLGTTKGRIVRRRQTGLKLPTGNRRAVKARVDPERFRDLRDLHLMGRMEKNGISTIAPVTVEQVHAAEAHVPRDGPQTVAPVRPLKQPTVAAKQQKETK